MDRIEDLLAQRRPQEPPEISAIKKYIQEHFQSAAKIQMHQDSITITVASASLAGTLRMRLLQIQEAAQTDKRLVLRIG